MAGYMHWLGAALDRHDLRRTARPWSWCRGYSMLDRIRGLPLGMSMSVPIRCTGRWASAKAQRSISTLLRSAHGPPPIWFPASSHGNWIACAGKAARAKSAKRRDGIIKEELRPLLAESPAILRADLARYLATRVPGAVQGLVLRPEAFAALAALEADMVALGEARKTRGNSARNRAWHKAGNKKKRIIWLNSSVCSGAKRQAKPSGNS